jgi:hypothetical protein
MKKDGNRQAVYVPLSIMRHGYDIHVDLSFVMTKLRRIAML